MRLGPTDRVDPASASGRRADGIPPRSEITVLVVDDTPAIRYALARGMRKLGDQVVEAANGQQALQLAGRCSAVLLDVRLPDMLGTEVCRLLRQSPKTAGLPVVHVSSLGPGEHAMGLADFDHADAYLLSPVHPESAAAIIEDLLRKRSKPA